MKVQMDRLVGVYSSPNHLVEYADGSCVQVIALNFEAVVIGGEISLSNETTDIRFFLLADIMNTEIILEHNQRILDTLTKYVATFIR